MYGTVQRMTWLWIIKFGLSKNFGAGNETRTRDPDLGKVVLYQLSYSRITCISEGSLILLASATTFKFFGAGNETRTRDPDLGKVVLYQLSYSRITCISEGSLILLASATTFKFFGAGNETRTRDPDLGKVVLYQLSYSRPEYYFVPNTIFLY